MMNRRQAFPIAKVTFQGWAVKFEVAKLQTLIFQGLFFQGEAAGFWRC